MAEQFIENLYSIARLPHELNRCLEACRVKDAQLFAILWNRNSQTIVDLCEKYIVTNSEYGISLYEACKELSKLDANLNEIAYLLEEEIIPGVYEYISLMDRIDIVQDEWRIISTKSQLLNLYNVNTKRYYHSKVDPLSDAWIEAGSLYENHINQIVIMGAGLGYLPYQLWKKSNETANIIVFERSSAVVAYAKMYGVLEWINKDNLNIIVEENVSVLFDRFVNLDVDYSRSVFLISDDFAEEVSEPLKNDLKAFIRNQRSVNVLRNLKRINHYNNIEFFDDDIVNFANNVELNKKFIVVAAGPSLNEKIEYIKEVRSDRTIIVVETALRKLLNNDIIPDFVTIIDPCVEVMNYIKGIEAKTEEICLLAPTFAYSGYLKAFRGPRLQVYAGDDENIIGDANDDKHINLGTHSTVSGLAIEEAVFLGATHIELVGLDLGFPDNITYADGLGRVTNDLSGANSFCRANDGRTISTTLVFNKFKSEIECQIDKYGHIKFTNLSQKGAYISGTFTDKWYETRPYSFADCVTYLDNLADDVFLNWNEKYFLLEQIITCIGNDFTDSEQIEINDIGNKVLKNIADNIATDNIYVKQAVGEIVYLMTSHFSESLENEKMLLDDAYKLISQYGMKVIIINSAEHLGGKKTAISECLSQSYESRLNNESFIEYKGINIAYFECSKPMPDEAKMHEILSFISENPPKSIVGYDRFSLLTYLCRRYWTVEYR